MNVFTYLALVLAASSCPVFGQESACSAFQVGVPISSERVFPVRDQRQSEARDILGERTFILLSSAQLDELTQRPIVSYEEMLRHQAERAAKEAARDRELAAMPHLAKHREVFLRSAVACEEFAAYTSALPKNAQPYLIKANVYSEGTGAFSIFLKARTLYVSHGSLGSGGGEPGHSPIVVLVESEIDTVEASASSAK